MSLRRSWDASEDYHPSRENIVPREHGPRLDSSHNPAASQNSASAPEDVGYAVEPQPVVYRKETRRDLDWKDVAALIINKMVGTGIFTGPLTVLLATNSKAIALTLWVLGFAYTVLRYETFGTTFMGSVDD